jgi:hypothetical protein
MTRFTPEKEQKILRVLEDVTRRASTELGWNPHEIAGRQEQE